MMPSFRIPELLRSVAHCRNHAADESSGSAAGKGRIDQGSPRAVRLGRPLEIERCPRIDRTHRFHQAEILNGSGVVTPGAVASR